MLESKQDMKRRKNRMKIIWKGKSTNGNWKRTEEVNSMEDLYYRCVQNDTVNESEYSPIEKFCIERAGLNYYEFESEITEICEETDEFFQEVFERICKERNIDMRISDKDYYDIISEERGNAYYQEFKDEDGNDIEFDKDGNIKKMSKLKAIRLQNNYSQSELAKYSGVNVRMIQHYEQGVKPLEKAEATTVYKLADALGCDMEELLNI